MPISLKNKENKKVKEGTKTTGSDKSEFIPSRVFSVILSSDHPKYTGEDSVGTIYYGAVGSEVNNNINLDSLNTAKPLFSFIKYIPLINEIVLILKTTSRNIYSDTGGDSIFTSGYYLPNVNVWNNPQQNALPSPNLTKPPPTSAGEASVGLQQNNTDIPYLSSAGNLLALPIQSSKTLYQNIDGTGPRGKKGDFIVEVTMRNLVSDETAFGVGISANSNIANSLAEEDGKAKLLKLHPLLGASSNLPSDTTTPPLGDYFAENNKSKAIQPFEGDMIFEGRFGNSMRFGSSNPRGKNNWSENDSEGEPITIIANGQPQVSGDTILEDINTIDSIVVFTSNQNIDNFLPSSINVQSIGAEFTPPSSTQVIIEDTPDPPIVIQEDIADDLSYSPADVTTEDIIEENVSNSSPPKETQITSSIIIDDPIWALLDEAIEEGTLTLRVESILSIAGEGISEADEREEEENEGSIPNTAVDADWVINNAKITASGKRGVTLINKYGKPHFIPSPQKYGSGLSLGAPTTEREINQIYIHTSAGNISSTPVSIMDFFLRPNTHPDPDKFNGRYWDKGGYHWMVEQNGDATRLYPDSEIAHGVKNQNSDSIHLNWIGGVDGMDITKEQAYTLQTLMYLYTRQYPTAKVIGHNQSAAKECPWFSVPRFAKLTGVDSTQINNSDVYGMDASDAVQNAEDLIKLIVL